MIKYGEAIQAVIESGRSPTTKSPVGEGEKFFDYMTWDPRGVNNSLPHHDCIADFSDRQIWQAQMEALGNTFNNSIIYNQVFALQRQYGVSCSVLRDTNSVDGEHVGRYIGTANVVRDMVEIIERHGEWREKEAKHLIFNSCQSKIAEPILQRTAWRRGEEKLQYWGFSYGTLLGQSFATMQPHRV